MKIGFRLLEWLVLIELLVLLAVGLLTARGALHAVAPSLTPISSTPSPTDTPTPTPTPTSTATPTLTSTPTSTPTATSTPTPTATPTSTPTPSPVPIVLHYATPVLTTSSVVTSMLPQPTPMPTIEQPEDTINILLLGSDRRPGEKIARTDVMMVISIFPDLPSVSILSIPRDYYAWIPTWGLDKINTAYLRGYKMQYPGGGPGLVKATVEYNFGVPIHFYALVDFNGFRSIVDALGGVDVVVECPFHDTYPDAESPTGTANIDLEPGLHHLDGKHALWYVRSRWNTSDFDRHRRQQQVVYAMYAAARQQNLLFRVPQLWEAYKDTVETDLGLPELLYLASVAARLDERDIKQRFIRGATLLTSMRAPNGGAVLAPKAEAMYDFLREAMHPPLTSRATQRAHRVAVLNGSGHEGWGHVAAYRLGLEGFEVVSVSPATPIPHTTVVDYTTTAKGSPLYKLLRLYRLQAGEVVKQPTEGSEIEFQVTLGQDYDPCVGTVTARWRSTPTPTPTPAP